MPPPVRLPYFDTLLGLLGKGDPVLEEVVGRHVHWGYWPEPARADGSPEDFARAAEALSRLVQRAAGVDDGEKVLDAGCGFGGTTESMNDGFSGMELVGLNIDRRQLIRAQSRFGARPGNTLAWVQSDACVLPFPDASFDAVLAVECVFHFPSRERFFREAFRVLKPGGRLALSDFLPTIPLKPFMHIASAWPFDRWFYGRCRFHYALPDYRRLALATGFRVRHERDITANTLPTYGFLRALAGKRFQVPSLSAAVQTLFGEWASRAGALRYMVLGFEKAKDGRVG